MDRTEGNGIHFAQDEEEYQEFSDNKATDGAELAGFFPEQAEYDNREELSNAGIAREQQIDQQVGMENGKVKSNSRQDEDEIPGYVLHMFWCNVFIVMTEAAYINVAGNEQ